MTPAPRRLLHSHANVEFLPSSYRIFVALTDGVVHPGPADKRDVPGLNFGRNSEGRVCCSSMKELVVKILNSSQPNMQTVGLRLFLRTEHCM